VLEKDLDIQEAFPITGGSTIRPPLDGTHYRGLANGLRKLARQCRPAFSRRELLQLAASFDRRAAYFDSLIR
jgi:hypothetical protein